MRIVEDSPSHLRLRDSLSLLSYFLLAVCGVILVFAAVGHGKPALLINAGLFAAAGFFFRRVSDVDLDKAAKRCRISRLDMVRRTEQTIAFDAIVDVRLELQRPNTSAQDHARIDLVTASGSISLTAGFAPGVDRQIALREAMVDVIFLGRPRPAPLDPVQVLADGGRVMNAAVRLARRDGLGIWDALKRTRARQLGAGR
jgi:hypothetical protein